MLLGAAPHQRQIQARGIRCLKLLVLVRPLKHIPIPKARDDTALASQSDEPIRETRVCQSRAGDTEPNPAADAGMSHVV
jgi:hypothetical protein